MIRSSATFNDGGTAQISSFVKIQLPTTEAERILHSTKTSTPTSANVLDAVRAHLTNCIKSTGPMMSASENQASRKAEFNQVVEEQLTQGLFEMRRTEVELKDVPEARSRKSARTASPLPPRRRRPTSWPPKSCWATTASR